MEKREEVRKKKSKKDRKKGKEQKELLDDNKSRYVGFIWLPFHPHTHTHTQTHTHQERLSWKKTHTEHVSQRVIPLQRVIVQSNG